MSACCRVCVCVCVTPPPPLSTVTDARLFICEAQKGRQGRWDASACAKVSVQAQLGLPLSSAAREAALVKECRHACERICIHGHMRAHACALVRRLKREPGPPPHSHQKKAPSQNRSTTDGAAALLLWQANKRLANGCKGGSRSGPQLIWDYDSIMETYGA